MSEKKTSLRKIYEGDNLICEIGVSKLKNVGYGVDTKIIIKIDDIVLAIERVKTPKPHTRDILTFYAPERFMMNMQRGYIFDEELLK